MFDPLWISENNIREQRFLSLENLKSVAAFVFTEIRTLPLPPKKYEYCELKYFIFQKSQSAMASKSYDQSTSESFPPTPKSPDLPSPVGGEY